MSVEMLKNLRECSAKAAMLADRESDFDRDRALSFMSRFCHFFLMSTHEARVITLNIRC